MNRSSHNARRNARLAGLAGLAAFLLAAAPALAQGRRYVAEDNSLRFRLGLLEPQGESEYWSDKRLDFSGEVEDLEDGTFGIEYERRLAPVLGFLIGGSFFEGQTEQAYLDFEDRFGNDIAHTTTLGLSSLDVGLVLHLAPQHAPIVPYVGGGGSAVSWRLEEDGDFIDFGVVPEDIFNDRFEDDGVALGWFVVAGLDVPLGPNWSLFAEARWRDAQDELSGDFEDFGELDLSAREFSAGAAWRF